MDASQLWDKTTLLNGYGIIQETQLERISPREREARIVGMVGLVILAGILNGEFSAVFLPRVRDFFHNQRGAGRLFCAPIGNVPLTRT